SSTRASAMPELELDSSGALPADMPGPWRALWRAYSRSRGALVGFAVIVVLVLLAAFAAWVAPHSPTEQYRDATLAPPVWSNGGSAAFVLGTDPVGRDILSRLLYG